MIYKKIDISCAVFCKVSDDAAMEFIDHRINKKKPLTQGAFNRAMNQAAVCESMGITKTATDAVEFTCSQGWDGVTPEYIKAELANRFNAELRTRPLLTMQTKHITLEQQLNDRSWAH